jgi:cytochrome c-type biogenesis protein
MIGSPAHVILDGALILAIPIALLAGLVSFASPCVLPLVPGYLGYVTGMTGAELGEHGARRRSRMLVGVGLFVLGFTVVFVALGVTFGAVGLALRPWQDMITRVLGVVVVLLGLGFLGFVPFLERERRIHLRPGAGLLGAPLLGIVFGLGWAPCIGPTLGAVLSLSLDGGSPVRGGVLAVAYCLGLGIPFLVLALAFQRSSRALGILRRHRLLIMRLGGALLILVGLALVTGLWGTWVHSLQGLISGFEPVL